MDYVLYLRVSTARQGHSGLGLEGQRLIAEKFIRPDDRILAEYIEVESGRKTARPQLAAAIEDARRQNAVLLVAKLDRLARNVVFLATLMESRVRFKACDMPEADEFTLHVLAAVAQKEAKNTSDNTKRALAAKKTRGGKLGNPQNLTPEATAKGRANNQRNAAEATANRQARRMIALLREQGMSLRKIAKELNAHGYKTRRNKEFTQTTVQRLLPKDTAVPTASPGAEPGPLPALTGGELPHQV
jgi:DNA invertase Pin-like site-specific DNA recombinase